MAKIEHFTPKRRDTENLQPESAPPPNSIAPGIRRIWAALLDLSLFSGVLLFLLAISVSVYVVKAILAPSGTNYLWDAALYNATVVGFMAYLGTAWGWYLYIAWFQSSKRQGTPGMMLAGIKTTTLSGRRLSFVHASARTFAEYFVYSISTAVMIIPLVIFSSGSTVNLSAGATFLAVEIVACALSAIITYSPLRNNKTKSFADALARTYVIKDEAQYEDSPTALLSRAAAYLVAPYVALITLLSLFPDSLDFAHFGLGELALAVFAILHLIGLSLSIAVRKYSHWILVWLTGFLPFWVAFCSGTFLWRAWRNGATPGGGSLRVLAGTTIALLIAFISAAVWTRFSPRRKATLAKHS